MDEKNRSDDELLKKRVDSLRKTMKIAGIAIAIIIICCVISAIANPSGFKRSGDGWEVVTTQPYIRGGKKCMGYRVYVEDSSYLFLNNIADTLSKDKYPESTIWFYYTKEAASGTEAAFEQIIR